MVALTDAQGMESLARRVSEAKSRGYECARSDALYGYWNDSPLSGEWAGGSVPELLGDLIESDDDYEIICEAYESGYEEGQTEA